MGRLRMSRATTKRKGFGIRALQDPRQLRSRSRRHERVQRVSRGLDRIRCCCDKSWGWPRRFFDLFVSLFAFDCLVSAERLFWCSFAFVRLVFHVCTHGWFGFAEASPMEAAVSLGFDTYSAGKYEIVLQLASSKIDSTMHFSVVRC